MSQGTHAGSGSFEHRTGIGLPVLRDAVFDSGSRRTDPDLAAWSIRTSPRFCSTESPPAAPSFSSATVLSPAARSSSVGRHGGTCHQRGICRINGSANWPPRSVADRGSGRIKVRSHDGSSRSRAGQRAGRPVHDSRPAPDSARWADSARWSSATCNWPRRIPCQRRSIASHPVSERA